MKQMINLSKRREIHNKLKEHAAEILACENFKKTREYFQHGNVRVHQHSIDVAKTSLLWSGFLPFVFREREMVRGALLHDYFLYDWHDKSVERRPLHGFFHPDTALKNAERDFKLSDCERNIIKNHMWPLTIRHIPTCREAWLVTAADKYCSLLETLRIRKGRRHYSLERYEQDRNK